MVNTFLSKKVLNEYDTQKVYNKVGEVYDLFDYLESAINDFMYPIVSNSGRVRYEQFVKGINNSKVENFILKKEMFILRGDTYERNKFATKVTIALRRLSKIELVVFKYSIYDHIDIEEISEKIAFGLTKTKDIKKSAFVKFLIALNLDQDCLKGGDKLRVQSYFQNKARATL